MKITHICLSETSHLISFLSHTLLINPEFHTNISPPPQIETRNTQNIQNIDPLSSFQTKPNSNLNSNPNPNPILHSSRKILQQNQSQTIYSSQTLQSYHPKHDDFFLSKQLGDFTHHSKDSIDVHQLFYFLANLSAVIITNAESFIALCLYIPHLPDECVIITTRPLFELGMILVKQYDMWNHTNLYEILETAMDQINTQVNITLPNLHSMVGHSLRFACLSFNEVYTLNKSFSIKCMSSGYSLGTPNFLIQDKNMDFKFAYISKSNVVQNRYTSQMDFEEFRFVDLLLIDGINHSSYDDNFSGENPLIPNQVSHQMMCEQLSSAIGLALSRGGDVFIPCKSTGALYDIIELVQTYISSFGVQANLYFISPIAEALLKYANVFSEYLNEIRQNKALFTNEQPFEFETQVQTNNIQIFSTISLEFAKVYHSRRNLPSVIIFAGDETLETKDSKSIIQIIQKNVESIILFVEPEKHPETIITRLNKISPKINFKFCPLDLRLNLESSSALLREIQPQSIICNLSFKKALNDYNILHAKDFDYSSYTVHPYSCHIASFRELIQVYTLKRKYKLINLEKDLTDEIFPNKTGEYRISYIEGKMTSDDGVVFLSSLKKKRKFSENSNFLLGVINPDELLQSLQATDSDCLIIENEGENQDEARIFRFYLPNLNANIYLSLQTTIIECKNEETRKKLRQIIKTQLFNL